MKNWASSLWECIQIEELHARKNIEEAILIDSMKENKEYFAMDVVK